VDNKGTDLSSNKIALFSKESLTDDQITPLWKEFCTSYIKHISPGILHIFKEPILQMYPDFEKNISLKQLNWASEG